MLLRRKQTGHHNDFNALVALIFDRQRLAGTIRREAGGSAGLKVGRHHQTKKHQGHDPLDNVSHFEAGGYRRSL
jgi:hypothetical protein